MGKSHGQRGMVKGYVPAQGDFVTLSFDPQAGHEQKGRRPALVISKQIFNDRTGLAFVCPITSTDRGYPFHARIPAGQPVRGVVMVDQTRAVDYKARKIQFRSRAPEDLLIEVLSLLEPIIF